MSKKKKKDKKSPVSVICSALGTVLLVGLVLVLPSHYSNQAFLAMMLIPW